MANQHFAHARIRVADVLEQVGRGMAYEAIIEEWRYELDRDAVAKSLFAIARVPRWRWQSLNVKKWNLNHCGVKVHYLGNNDREVNHARIKKALTITR